MKSEKSCVIAFCGRKCRCADTVTSKSAVGAMFLSNTEVHCIVSIRWLESLGGTSFVFRVVFIASSFVELSLPQPHCQPQAAWIFRKVYSTVTKKKRKCEKNVGVPIP